MKSTLQRPKHPERICWGCDRFCPADDLACGNGTIRTPHPMELFGEDWLEWSDSRNRNGSSDIERDEQTQAGTGECE